MKTLISKNQNAQIVSSFCALCWNYENCL